MTLANVASGWTCIAALVIILVLCGYGVLVEYLKERREKQAKLDERTGPDREPVAREGKWRW